MTAETLHLKMENLNLAGILPPASEGKKERMEFYVEGKVVPKQSFRYSYKGGYISNDVRLYAHKVRNSFESEYPNWRVDNKNPFKMEIDIFFKIPKGKSKTFKTRCLAGEIRPIKRPDIDNCGKNVLDALNGIVYADDKQIVELTVRKYYAEIDYAKISIKEVDNESN